MDSINKNQTEAHHENLKDGDAIKRIQEMVKHCPSCFFCTEKCVPGSIGVRPMGVRQVDDQGFLWFLSSSDSHKNKEIQANPNVKLFFQGSAHSNFLNLQGQASIIVDREKLKELWTPIIQTWFTEGIDDPRITIIKFEPYTGYYWDTKHGHVVAGIKMLFGAMMKKTMDDSMEGWIEIR